MLKFEVDPRIKIGDKVWVASHKEETNQVYAEKALVIGYKFITTVTGYHETMEIQYIVLLSNLNYPEVDVHKVPTNYYLKHGELFWSVIVEEEHVYFSEQEILGRHLN